MTKSWKKAVKNREVGLCKHSEMGGCMAGVAGEQRQEERRKMKKYMYTTLRATLRM